MNLPHDLRTVREMAMEEADLSITAAEEMAGALGRVHCLLDLTLVSASIGIIGPN